MRRVHVLMMAALLVYVIDRQDALSAGLLGVLLGSFLRELLP